MRKGTSYHRSASVASVDSKRALQVSVTSACGVVATSTPDLSDLYLRSASCEAFPDPPPSPPDISILQYRALSDTRHIRRSKRMRRIPVLDRMLAQKLHAIGACTAMLRQKSGDTQMDMLLKVKSDFSPCSRGRSLGGKRQQVELSRHLWGNKSFPHLLSHVRGYLSARERMRLCCVSRHWNDPTANLTISRLEILQDATLTDANFRRILAKHKSLRYVNILGCCRLTDGSLENIALAVPKLRELNISYCLQITDEGLASLRQCENLRRLHTAACNKITEEAMEELHKKLKKLERPFMPIPRLTRQTGAYGWKPRVLNGFDDGDEGDEKGGGAKLLPPPASANLDRFLPSFSRLGRKKTTSASSVDSRSSRSPSPSS